ncbi:MAG: hypothetical protein KIS66_13455 [Fimbriimonadaceae bacterium]|nr:hypothetical protein [Fimbriimonadaceae bacterium]
MDDDGPRTELIRKLDRAQRILAVVLILLCVFVGMLIGRSPLLMRFLTRG